MIIDAHVHIGGKNILEMKESEVLSAMKKYKIDKIVVSNADSVEFYPTHEDLPQELSTTQYNSTVRAINFARNNPKNIFIAPWIKPNTEKLEQDFIDLVQRNMEVIKAIKVHPFHSALRFNDNKLIEYIEFAKKLDIPMIIHTAHDEFSNPDFVYEVAKNYPSVKFILAHLELVSDNKHAIDLCSKLPNLYADTAWVPIKSAIQFIQKCGNEKLMFGSDMPIDGEDTYLHNKEGQRSIYQDYFFEIQKFISPDDYENLMFKNAMKIFGI